MYYMHFVTLYNYSFYWSHWAVAGLDGLIVGMIDVDCC